MKDDFKRIKQDVELRYLPIDKQEDKAGYIIGNSNFDEEQLNKLKMFKSNRDKIWRDIEKNFDPEQCFNIACIIYDGFLYLTDNGSIREHSRGYQKRKKKILDYVKRLNEELYIEDSSFHRFPLQIDIAPHHLDSPINAHRPTIGKTRFIKRIGEELEERFPAKYERAKLVSRILRFFFAVPEDQADPKIIRNQF